MHAQKQPFLSKRSVPCCFHVPCAADMASLPVYHTKKRGKVVFTASKSKGFPKCSSILCVLKFHTAQEEGSVPHIGPYGTGGWYGKEDWLWSDHLSS